MRVLVVVLVLLPFLAAQAHADYDETERRLKGAGIDEALRKRIHTAIDRGVDRLIKRQRRDGTFRPKSWPSQRTGVSALAGLALRHAGTPKAKAAAAKALAFLAAPDGKGAVIARARTYDAGIIAMLLMCDLSHPEVADELAARFVSSQSASGWWGYFIWSPTNEYERMANLSTTQFAALGLWATARNGATVPASVWRKHLESLLRNQGVTGSWAYRTDSLKSYATGTVMGAANFALAEKALGDTFRSDVPFYRKVVTARLRMLDAVRKDGVVILEQAIEHKGRPGASNYYSLYSLEKACLFLGLERLGEVDWYRKGALKLLAAQRKNGGWGDPVNTAFALLFLLRSSAAYRPTTPSPVDQKPITAGESKKKPSK